MTRTAIVDHIGALTGVRALASVWVVSFHLRPVIASLFPSIYGVFSAVADAGDRGVDLFFILSGFVLALNYNSRFSPVSARSWGRFLWLRLARIYPVHLLGLLVFAAFHLINLRVGHPEPSGDHFGFRTFIENLLLVHWWYLAPNLSWNYPSWTISMEWLAYLFFPFLTSLVKRSRSMFFNCFIAFSLLCLTTYLNLQDLPAKHIIRLGAEFAAGCFLWAVWRDIQPTRSRFWRFSAIPVMLGSIVFSSRLGWYIIPFLGFAILALALDRSLAARIFGSRPMVYAGNVSYSLYMMHAAVISACHVVLPLARFENSNLLTRLAITLAYVGGITCTGIFVFEHIEEPLRMKMRRLVGIVDRTV
jgi:peptidoglycan/LPS O-acetylase OafA/YrhL